MSAERRRLLRLIAASIGRFGLQLQGLKVLTEAASGPFAATALIAACGGADVQAVTRDSSYGSAVDVAAHVIGLAEELGVAHRVVVSTGPSSAVAEGCNIVTNLGFVRPIDASVVDKLAADAVVALMWEPWEFRAEDISCAALAARSIPLIGTRETHPLIATFRYVGALAGRLLFEAGIEIVGARIGVVGSDPFGTAAAGWLKDAGGTPILLRTPIDGDRLAKSEDGFDALVLLEHRDHGVILGDSSATLVKRLGRDGAPVVRICGGVDRGLLARHDVRLHPDRDVRPGFMSITTGYLGPRSVIDLHAGGLRAAQDAVRARRAGASVTEAIAASVAGGFGLAFENVHQ